MSTDSKRPISTEYPGKELEAMSFALNYHQWIIDEFAPFMGDSVVEVGAGIGDLSELILATGVERLHSYEPSRNLFPGLQKKLEPYENTILVNDFFSLESCPEQVDSVMYVNVLEHIENDEVELRTAYQSLPSSGYLLIFVPALPWLFSEADKKMGHFRRYSKSGLDKLVSSAGFQIESVRYFDVSGVLPWYINFVLLKNSLGHSSVALYDRLVVPVTRWIESWLKPPVGKNILLIARKN